MIEEWPKRFNARLNAWSTAREISHAFQIEHSTEQKMIDNLHKLIVVLEVEKDGKVKVVLPEDTTQGE